MEWKRLEFEYLFISIYEIEFVIEDGRDSYNEVKRNGIQSNKRGNYIRSIRFLGEKISKTSFFSEDYNPPNIFTNWVAKDSAGASNTPSKWSFNSHPQKSGLVITESSGIDGMIICLEFNRNSVNYWRGKN